MRQACGAQLEEVPYQGIWFGTWWKGIECLLGSAVLRCEKDDEQRYGE
jgi:hypothetical protein